LAKRHQHATGAREIIPALPPNAAHIDAFTDSDMRHGVINVALSPIDSGCMLSGGAKTSFSEQQQTAKARHVEGHPPSILNQPIGGPCQFVAAHANAGNSVVANKTQLAKRRRCGGDETIGRNRTGEVLHY